MGKAAFRWLARAIALAACALAWGSDATDPQSRLEHMPRAEPRMPLPALYRPFRDPAFGSMVMRVTDASQSPGATRIRHYYAKSQPFNADGTLAILVRSDGGASLYDARSWVPLKSLSIASGDPEFQWHPTDPSVFYYLDPVGGSPNVRGFFRYDVRTDQRTLLHDFAEYDTARARNEGNMDREGRYYAMVGWKSGRLEAFVYDVREDRVLARLPVTESQVSDWISMSPSGNYVVMMGKHRARIYDRNLRHLRDLPEGSIGHGDLCLLEDGSEALVYDGADHRLALGRHLNVADLATGREFAATRIGWRSTPHVSCRNLAMPGWALVSTQGPDKRYPNHDFEVFWMKLDGSGLVRRIAHHHSRTERGGYFAEPQAVPSRSGDRVLFASNWGEGFVAEYVVAPPRP